MSVSAHNLGTAVGSALAGATLGSTLGATGLAVVGTGIAVLTLIPAVAMRHLRSTLRTLRRLRSG